MSRTYHTAILVTNRTDYFSNHDMLSGIHEGLTALGIAAELFIVEPDGRDLGPFMERIEAAAESDFLVDLNAKMRFESTKSVKKFSFITDHPAVMLEYLAATPPGNVFGYVDRNHLDFHAAIGLPQRCVFFPHGGPPPDPAPLAMAKRDIGALFIGRLDGPSRLGDLKDSLKGTPKLVIDVIIETALAAADGAALWRAFTNACEGRGIAPLDFDAAGISAAITAAGAFAEARNRRRMLEALNGIPLTHVGHVADGFFDRPPGSVTFMGERPFDECLDLMKRSRLVLNSLSVFPQGSHERIWYGMAAGAAVITDPSTFVNEDFTDRENIMFWPSDPADGALMAAEALADPGRLDEMAAAAMPLYAAKHTWASRAGIIERAINGS